MRGSSAAGFFGPPGDFRDVFDCSYDTCCLKSFEQNKAHVLGSPEILAGGWTCSTHLKPDNFSNSSQLPRFFRTLAPVFPYFFFFSGASASLAPHAGGGGGADGDFGGGAAGVHGSGRRWLLAPWEQGLCQHPGGEWEGESYIGWGVGKMGERG